MNRHAHRIIPGATTTALCALALLAGCGSAAGPQDPNLSPDDSITTSVYPWVSEDNCYVTTVGNNPRYASLPQSFGTGPFESYLSSHGCTNKVLTASMTGTQWFYASCPASVVSWATAHYSAAPVDAFSTNMCSVNALVPDARVTITGSGVGWDPCSACRF